MCCSLKVHSHGASVTASKSDLNIEVYVAVQAADENAYVNSSINLHRTCCMRKEKFDAFADVVAPFESTLRLVYTVRFFVCDCVFI